MGDYKPLHPDHYPTRWLTVAKLAIPLAATDNPWMSIDWGSTDWAAINRMARLRAFAKGLFINRYAYPDIAKMIDDGWELTFRKLQKFDVWDVQAKWKPASHHTDIKRLLTQAIADYRNNGDNH